MTSAGVRGLVAPGIAAATAAAFFGLARAATAAPLLSVWGGAVWVFVLTSIIALPLVAPRGRPTPPPAATANRGGTMGLAVVVWLCALPLVVLLAAPRLGAAGAAGVAVAVLAVVVLGCWVLCAWSRVRWHRAEGGVR